MNAWWDWVRHRPWRVAAVIVTLVGATWGWLYFIRTDAKRNTPPEAATTRPNPAPGADSAPPPGGKAPYSHAGMQTRQDLLAMAQRRYDRAEQVYATYRDATRYPFDSRPIAEHPDQLHPFAPIEEELQLRGDKGELVRGLRLRTTQERVFLSGQESVKFTVSAVDDAGTTLPLIIRNAAAQTIPDSKTPVQLIHAALPFVDNGTGADDVANDGRYSARLVPATQGFANHNGTIRVLAEVAANGQQGFAQFDVVYAPDVPATWGSVREAVEGGSLNFYIGAQVRRGGRYVVSARVDDANGKPFALVQFNDEVGEGNRQFKLQVFGALIRDKNPAFPLRLRDVDGFLLIPDQFPDRATLPRLAGIVHSSQLYHPDRFSSAEWNSDERQRYLNEYAKDAEDARRALADLTR